MAWFKLVPKDKKLLKSSRVRAWVKYCEDEIEKELPYEKAMDRAMEDVNLWLVDGRVRDCEIS